ncbi:MAG: hypothetical protein RBT87_03410 [bacterium]|jgi:hypothetical protein|nr:hypothetical protein [bacterium]
MMRKNITFFFLILFIFLFAYSTENKDKPVELESVFYNENHVNCQKYCAVDPECVKCVKSSTCDFKFEKIKTFKGPGRNYTACKPVKSENYEECVKYCDSNYRCDHCDSTMNCGVSFVNIKSFRGKGTNWYACEKIRDINSFWASKVKIKPEHRYLVVANGGYGGLFGHDGIEWFCEKYLTPEIAPEALCIGAYGRPRTATWMLSENIKNTVMLMEKVTGVRPQVIMLGKSMGGCKLHHAVAGEKGGSRGGLEKLDISLFVGVDMSCQVKRHFEDPEDILEFKSNIKELWNFYQLNVDTSQTGHRAHFEGQPFDDSIHINVNVESFDTDKNAKIVKPEKPLCENAAHLNVDECVPLLETIQKLVLKKMGKIK